jgi:hypothetical protein
LSASAPRPRVAVRGTRIVPIVPRCSPMLSSTTKRSRSGSRDGGRTVGWTPLPRRLAATSPADTDHSRARRPLFRGWVRRLSGTPVTNHRVTRAPARLCPQRRLPPLAKLAHLTSLVATGCGLLPQHTLHFVAREPGEQVRVSPLLRHLAHFSLSADNFEFRCAARAG